MGWGTLPPTTTNAAVLLSAVVGPVYTNLHPECELSCSDDFVDEHEVVKLMVGTGTGTIYQVTSYLRMLIWSVLTCMCKMS